jgi:hypothetical protein
MVAPMAESGWISVLAGVWSKALGFMLVQLAGTRSQSPRSFFRIYVIYLVKKSYKFFLSMLFTKKMLQ